MYTSANSSVESLVKSQGDIFDMIASDAAVEAKPKAQPWKALGLSMGKETYPATWYLPCDKGTERETVQVEINPCYKFGSGGNGSTW